MKKLLAIILSLLISLSMMLTFVGCDIDSKSSKKDKDSTSQSEKDDEKDNEKDDEEDDNGKKDNEKKEEKEPELTDEEIFVGEWLAEFNLEEMLAAEMVNADEEIAMFFEYVDLSGFAVYFDFEFTDDGVCTLAVNERETEKALEDIVVELQDGVIAFIEDMIAEEGLDMTVDELLAEMGMTMDEFSEMMMEEMDLDTFMDSFTDEFAGVQEEGEYEIEDGEIYVDGEVFGEYEIIDEDEIEISNEGMTLVLTRQ